jgi:hypothetical protein
MAMPAYVAELIARQGSRGRVVVLYNDLGVTASGRSVEWPGALQLAREHAAGDVKVDLWQMVRNHIAAARAQAVLDKGVKPWSEQQINNRAAAHIGRILASACRALRLLAQIPHEEIRRLQLADRQTLP